MVINKYHKCKTNTCISELEGKKIWCNKCLDKARKIRKEERDKNSKKSSEYENIYMGHLNQ